MGGISVFRSRSRIRTRWKKIGLGPDPVKERFGPVPLKKIGPSPDLNKKTKLDPVPVPILIKKRLDPVPILVKKKRLDPIPLTKIGPGQKTD